MDFSGCIFSLPGAPFFALDEARLPEPSSYFKLYIVGC